MKRKHTARHGWSVLVGALALGFGVTSGAARAGGDPQLDGAEYQAYCTAQLGLHDPRTGYEPAWGGALAEVDTALGRIYVQICAARFEEALELARGAQGRLDLATPGPARKQRRVGLYVQMATAQAGLGRESLAVRTFQRALAVDDSLELDERRTSPKIRRLLESARRGRLARR